MAALSVPAAGPERANWAVSSDYHAVAGGHVRIYRRRELVGRCERAGLRLVGSHHAHGLHSPYWLLRCVVGVGRDDHPLVAAYHRFLVWDITHRPFVTRALERVLNPLIGKSLVVYVRKGRLMAGAAVQAAGFVEPGSAVEAILEVQRPDGMIPWFPGGHGDPWNHVEAAMALAATGELAAAARGLEWLARRQRADGSWHPTTTPAASRRPASTRTPSPTSRPASSSTCGRAGIPASPASMWPSSTGRSTSSSRSAPRTARSRGPSTPAAGRPRTRSSRRARRSTTASVRGVRLAATLGLERPDWARPPPGSAGLSAGASRSSPTKREFAMDWYYPALAGVLGLGAARVRLRARLGEFVVPEAGGCCAGRTGGG